MKSTCAWKEFVSDSGKKYYYNSLSKQSVWEMPQEYREWIEKNPIR